MKEEDWPPSCLGANASQHSRLCLAVAARLLPALMTLSLAGCAGYQVGVRSLYRPDVYSVFVPVFESDSLRRNLGEQLTEAHASLNLLTAALAPDLGASD